MELLGIDIGGSGIKGAPVDVTTGKLTAERVRIPTPRPASPEPVARVVAEMVQHFNWRGPVGCAFPARVKRGIARTAANIEEAWIGTDVAGLFSAHCGCPTTVVNDADAAALAEMTFGAGRDMRGVVMLLTFGTGIGTALFVDHRLVPNTELGHLTLRGMVAEHYASDRVRKVEDLSWEEWAGRAQEYLSLIEFLFDLDVIILGGGISKPKKTAQYLHLLTTDADLVTAQLENHAGIVGAALAAMP